MKERVSLANRGWIPTLFCMIAALAVGPAYAGSLEEEESCPADFDESGPPPPSCTTLLATQLTGAAERPGPGDPDGTGTAYFVVDTCAGTLCFVYSVSNIDGTASGAHVHLAPPESPGPIVAALPTPTLENGGVATGGCLTGVNAALLQNLADNPEQYYFNFHSTPNFGPGAVRGQLAEAN